MKFGKRINTLTDEFPSKELYNLSSQIRRADDFVALNISEGYIGQSSPEKHRFIGYAIRSLAELLTCLHKAKMREYISEYKSQSYYVFSYKLMNMIISFKKNIK